MKVYHSFRIRLLAFFLCFLIMAGQLPVLAAGNGDTPAEMSEEEPEEALEEEQEEEPVEVLVEAPEEESEEAPEEDSEEKDLSGYVSITEVVLYYAEDDGQLYPVQDKDLIGKDDKLALHYTYEINEKQCKAIEANTNYYLDVPAHLVLPTLPEGSPLEIEIEGEGKKQFGTIYADGKIAWVVFKDNGNGGTVIGDYGEIYDAYFYLDCGRAGKVPDGEQPIEGKTNLYVMTFESGDELYFGYAENAPLIQEAEIKKEAKMSEDAVMSGRRITWTITYTPWQNPSGEDGVTKETSFELRDHIDAFRHSYVKGSVKINGNSATEYDSRDTVPEDVEAYVFFENGNLVLGGNKFQAGTVTQGDGTVPMVITYDTEIQEDFLLNPLLPGNDIGQKIQITNQAELFAAGADNVYNSMNISGKYEMTVPSPVWVTKEGKTTRISGKGSVTDWKVTFNPNGFIFAEDHDLIFHDKLPDGSMLVAGTVKVGDRAVDVKDGNQEEESFTVSPIVADGQPVTVTYQTSVPEEMYDNGTSLGSNAAWFTFSYDGKDYITPTAVKPVGSGDGSGLPGTDTLVKSNKGYHASTRTIEWVVEINPHKANLKSGTFTDDLSIAGGTCNVPGHAGGMELAGADGSPGDENDIAVAISGSPLPTDGKVELMYDRDNRVISVKAENVGARAITLTYKTVVCDPCVFANNTKNKLFVNSISTNDMVVGSQSDEKRTVSADSTADVKATVLSKKIPIYDYATGKMKWTIEVNEAGLPMSDVVLTDNLPDGLTYVDGSFKAVPDVSGASAHAEERELKISLGSIAGKVTVTFDTITDPEKTGFNSNGKVTVTNSVFMEGMADGVKFEKVSNGVTYDFTNHGMVKKGDADSKKELIRYEVLINPYRLALPENPSLVDTLDEKLQLDMDTIQFYEVELSGITENANQKPNYTKSGSGQPLKVASYDPEQNTFSVQLPVEAGSRKAYVLTYTADIIKREQGNYSNRIHFNGGAVLLGGDKNNVISVGGGSGGGGGVASRKAGIKIIKTDSENTQKPLSGVTFTLYLWNDDKKERGMAFAQGTTDAKGELSFKVKPHTVYELVESGGLSGYDSEFGWETLPDRVTEMGKGLLIEAGAAGSEVKLNLTNESFYPDIEMQLLFASGSPMSGEKVCLFASDQAGQMDPASVTVAVVSRNGTVRLSGVHRNRIYYIRLPGGEIYVIKIPANDSDRPMIKLPDGREEELTMEYRLIGSALPDRDPGKPEGSGNAGNTTENDEDREYVQIEIDKVQKDFSGQEDSDNAVGTGNKRTLSPKTGDSTPGLAVIVLLLGILLAGMTVYLFRERKKHGKK